jgi:hypothetical protein
MLFLLCFCRNYYKMYIWCNYIMYYNTSILWHVLYPIGCLTLYGLTERIINEWMINRIILGEKYRSLSFSLCRFHNSLVISSLLGQNILLRTLFSNTLTTFLPQYERPCITPIQTNRQNYGSVYLNLYTFRYEIGRWKILLRMITSIPWLQSALNFFLNRILML